MEFMWKVSSGEEPGGDETAQQTSVSVAASIAATLLQPPRPVMHQTLRQVPRYGAR
jgi:hypothetical protein